MAVEARHLSLFPPQVQRRSDQMMTATMMMDGVVGGIGLNACSNNYYGTPLSYGVLSSAEAGTPFVPSTYNMTSASVHEHAAVPVKSAPLQSDSGLTYAAAVVPAAASRKRQRDEGVNNCLIMTSLPNILNGVHNNYHNDDHTMINNIDNQSSCGSFTFLGEDISPHLILQQQFDIDRFIAQHTEKVRLEIRDRRNQYSRKISATVEDNIMKKLKAKEDEIEKIGKLNSLLEERVKSLCVENQIWRELAQSNEATANALRSNLEQVLALVQDDRHHHQLQVQQHNQHHADLLAAEDDAQSCCGSNNYNNNDETGNKFISSCDINRRNNNTMCKRCGREESCVLILPCRHLCLCSVCASSVHTCPVCHSTKTRSLHVNLCSS